MTSKVRLYDAFATNLSSHEYTGRWTLDVDPFSTPGGTDGQFYEFDFVVADPQNDDRVFWGYIGAAAPMVPSTVTGGFTFDSDSPPGWADYWFLSSETKVTYQDNFDFYNYTPAVYYRATYFDGDYTDAFELPFDVTVDGASDPDWYRGAAASDPPTIVDPSDAGAWYGFDGQVFGLNQLPELKFTLAWSSTSQTRYQIVSSGLSLTGPGSFSGSAHSKVLTFGSRTLGTVTLSLRIQQTAKDWSDWITATIRVTADAFGLLPNDSTFDPGDPGPVDGDDFMVGYWFTGDEFSLDRVSSPAPVAGSGVARATVIDDSQLQVSPYFQGDLVGGPYYVQPGDEITFSVYLRTDPGNANPGLYLAQLNLDANRADHAVLATFTSTGGGYGDFTPIDSSGWTELTVTGTMPALSQQASAQLDLRWYDASVFSPLGSEHTNGDRFYLSAATANLRRPSTGAAARFLLGVTSFN